MKRIAMVAGVLGAVSFALGAPLASSQEPVPEETTTTVAPVEETTTTTAAPVEETTTTTVAPVEETTTTTTVPTTVEVPPVLLFGETIAAGTLDLDVQFEDEAAPDCLTTVPLDGGQMNRVNDADGDLGLIYGQAATNGGSAAVFLMELGVVPAGIGILSIQDAACSLDALGVGMLRKGPGLLALDGIGIGVHPNGYERYGKYLEQFDLTANVGASAGGANLDVASLQSFLLRDRAGLGG